jgi:methylmalonyl-CoA mutase
METRPLDLPKPMNNAAPASLPEAAALEAARAAWRATVEAELKGASFDKKLITRTFEGITLRPIYTRADPADQPGLAATLASLPGQAPFWRGTRPAGYAERGWEVAQEIAATTSAQFNQRLKADLMCGQDAVVLVAARAGHEGGLALGGSDDLRAALAGVALGAVPVHIETGHEAQTLATRYLDLAAREAVPGRTLRGSVTADPLGAWSAAGGLPATLTVLLDSLAAWTRRAAVEAPALRTIGVDGRQWAEAGGNAAQELAGALAAATEYLRALRARGLDLETIVPRLRATFSVGPQFFMEIAKLRAWRPLLVRVVVALGGAPTLVARAATHAATARWNQTRLDPHVNILRATTEAFAAVLGGVDALHIAPFDSATGGGGADFSRRIARNVHALLAEEFGATTPADPVGGSWYGETLTDELARRAWALFQQIEAQGGLTAALRAGLPQHWLAEAAAEKSLAAGTRRYGLVGTNLFPNLKETPLPAASFVTTMITASAETEIKPIRPFRITARFEALRDASAAFAARTGARPRVFLAKIGPVAQHKARADFCAGFFTPGGFEILAKQRFITPEEAAQAAASSGAQVAVLCSTDETYPELVPAFAAALRAAAPTVTRVLAGLPIDAAQQAVFTTAGIELFIHLRAPVEETLAQLLKKIGAL